MDRTTKALLALIAVALWGLLLKPLIALPAAQAAPQGGASGLPALVFNQSRDEAFIATGGYLYKIDTSSPMRVDSKVAIR
jgi:hypothetical protein